jgi:hypothetical protein
MVERLLQAARDLVREKGGTPYLTTSRRTPDWVVEALRSGLPSGGQLFVWTAEAEDNPYRAMLALADGFVVTGDSISMMVEAIKVDKPVAILPASTGPIGALDQLRRASVRWLFAAEKPDGSGGVRQASGRLLYRLRLVAHTRDFRAFHQHLFAQGLAVPVKQGPVRAPVRLPDDLSIVVARIKRLTLAG